MLAVSLFRDGLRRLATVSCQPVSGRASSASYKPRTLSGWGIYCVLGCLCVCGGGGGGRLIDSELWAEFRGGALIIFEFFYDTVLLNIYASNDWNNQNQ